MKKSILMCIIGTAIGVIIGLSLYSVLEPRLFNAFVKDEELDTKELQDLITQSLVVLAIKGREYESGDKIYFDDIFTIGDTEDNVLTIFKDDTIYLALSGNLIHQDPIPDYKNRRWKDHLHSLYMECYLEYLEDSYEIDKKISFYVKRAKYYNNEERKSKEKENEAVHTD